MTVKGASPRPVPAAQLLAYMYDRSLDLFAPHMPPPVASLYPTRTATGALRASLGQAPAALALSDDFPGASAARRSAPTA